ncbi:MAG: DUF6261 family protein [Bacteroidales bacterium]
MKKLPKNSRTTEVDAISDRIVEEYKQKVYDDAFLTSTMQGIEQLSAKITSAIKRSKVLSELEDLDAIRDNDTRALAKIIEGYANFPSGELKQIGLKVKSIFDKYSLSIITSSYDSQTAYTISLLEDLEKISADTAKLAAVPESIATLAASNQEFATKRREYQKEEAAEAQEDSASIIKPQLVNAINQLSTYLTSMRSAKPTEYAEFADLVEKVIDDQHKLMATRKTRNEKK